MKNHFMVFIALGVVSAPYAVPAEFVPFSAKPHIADCGCSHKDTQAQELKEAVPLPIGAGKRDPIPPCPGPGSTNCTSNVYQWIVCIRTSGSTQPPACQKFTHQYTVWFCSGATYYNCNGYSWVGPGDPCTPCSSGTSATLPAGCTPPEDPSAKYCRRT